MIAQLKRHCRFANSKHTFGGSLNPLGAGGWGGGERAEHGFRRWFADVVNQGPVVR